MKLRIKNSLHQALILLVIDEQMVIIQAVLYSCRFNFPYAFEETSVESSFVFLNKNVNYFVAETRKERWHTVKLPSIPGDYHFVNGSSQSDSARKPVASRKETILAPLNNQF